MNIKESYEGLKQAMKEDNSYAWSWLCNIACAIMDSGIPYMEANKAAMLVMNNCFGVQPRPLSENVSDDGQVLSDLKTYAWFTYNGHLHQKLEYGTAITVACARHKSDGTQETVFLTHTSHVKEVRVKITIEI